LDEADISVFDENVKSLFDGHIKEFLIDVSGVLFITLETENGEVFKGLRLMNHRVKTVGVL